MQEKIEANTLLTGVFVIYMLMAVFEPHKWIMSIFKKDGNNAT